MQLKLVIITIYCQTYVVLDTNFLGLNEAEPYDLVVGLVEGDWQVHDVAEVGLPHELIAQ